MIDHAALADCTMGACPYPTLAYYHAITELRKTTSTPSGSDVMIKEKKENEQKVP